MVAYHPCNPPILDIIQNNWKILECSFNPKCLSDKSVKLGFRRNPNLRDMLVHSRLSYCLKPQTRGVQPPYPNKLCMNAECNYCPLLDKSGNCISSITNHKYIVPSRLSCKLNNLIYLLSGTRCHVKYVGETYRSLKERLSEHLCDIHHECNPQYAPPSVIQKGHTTVARHFGRNQHTRDDLKVQILELIHLYPLGHHMDAYCETREHFWIHLLRNL